MKWKTSTIITILIFSIGVVVFTQYEKKNKISVLEDTMDDRVEERVIFEKTELNRKYETRIKSCEELNQAQQEEINELKEQIKFIRNGGENEYYIKQLKLNSKKVLEKIKIRKGEVYKHEKSGIVVYVRRDFYEDQIYLNITLPNEQTQEKDWLTGKYYYYWNSQENELSEIIPTFIGDEFIEIEWTYYKANQGTIGDSIK